MRVFLCAIGDFYVAIPMEFISSLTLLTGKERQYTNKHNLKNGNMYVSLFWLFNILPGNIRHGIVLKNDTAEKKIILLSTEIECETEIPNEEIYPIPKTLNGTRFSALFSGIQFTADKKNGPILLLHPEQLIQYMQKELIL